MKLYFQIPYSLLNVGFYGERHKNNQRYSCKLPLVLDLDDTLVRLVGEGNGRYVPEADIPQVRDLVAVLKDNRRVVLIERVHEFLEWAQNLYDISVCSLGDQRHVENVVNVLDLQSTRIRGILYSARSEHDYQIHDEEPFCTNFYYDD